MTSYKIEIKWAVIFMLFTLVWMWGEKALGYHDVRIEQHPVITNFFYLPAIALYVLALLDKRKAVLGGIMTYKQGFITGLIMTGFITLSVPLSQVIVSLVITPEYFTNVISYVVEHNMMTQEAAQAQFNLTNYIVQGLIGFPVIGVITSAIVALFTRKGMKNDWVPAQ